MSSADFRLYLSSDSDEPAAQSVGFGSAKANVKFSKIKKAQVKRSKKSSCRRKSTRNKKGSPEKDDDDDSSGDFELEKEKKSKKETEESHRPVEAFRQCFPLIPLGKPIAARPQYCQPDSSKSKSKLNSTPMINLIRLEVNKEVPVVEKEDDEDSSDVEIIDEIIVSKEPINQSGPDEMVEVKAEEIEILSDGLPDIDSLSESDDENEDGGYFQNSEEQSGDGDSQLKIMSVRGAAGRWFS